MKHSTVCNFDFVERLVFLSRRLLNFTQNIQTFLDFAEDHVPACGRETKGTSTQQMHAKDKDDGRGTEKRDTQRKTSHA